MIDNIPSFVLRGLSRRERPDLCDVMEMTYRDEADLRDAIAASWWLAGWDVRTEYKVPSCGRIDVLAQTPDVRVVIEVKQKIKTTGEARQAFQQAHAYVSYLDAVEVGRTRQIHGYVTAAEVNASATRAAREAYRGSVINADLSWLCVTGPHMIAHTYPETAEHIAGQVRDRRQSLDILAKAARSHEVSIVASIEHLISGATA